MRRGFISLFLIWALTTQGGQLPLTVKEISLMLRAGYSSSTLMQELSTRHFADTLDAAKEKTLTSAGASAELIDALRSGTYSLSAEKIAALQEQLADQAKKRTQQAEAQRQNEALYRAQPAEAHSAPPLNAGATSDAVYKSLKSDLVQWHNGALVHADDTVLENKKLIAFYFSAHWCGPCRKFTPQLVEYYNRVAPQHPEFEIVFFSFDRSPYAMQTYMSEANMPWPAIDYAKLKDKAALAKNAGNGIPSLVVVDSAGNLVTSSHSGSQYFGPQKVLADLDAIFAGHALPRVAGVR